ncbi:MAG: potassium transporter TrkA [Marinilabiliales bacterium]|nr:MAG: potassium transporter TrkA [Marinilabiliales bacterium]
MSKTTFKDRFKYTFDNLMSKGPGAIIAWLGIATLLLVLISAIFVAIIGILPAESEGMNFIEALWQSLMRSIDPGTVCGDEGWAFRILMLIITIGGIFIVSALIGIISAGFDQKIEQLRKGRSKVIETNHTLILGWSPKVFTVIHQLSIANENQHKPRIVVMSEEDKTDMEDAIKDQVETTRNSKVICRTGSPMDMNALDMVNFNGARAIIIVPPESEGFEDIFVIKTVLAIVNNPNRKKENYHITVEVLDEKNQEVIEMVAKDEVETLLLSDIIARLTVQAVHQPGLSIVIEELLRFEGDEIYFQKEPKVVGKTFSEAMLCYKDSTLIGLQYKDKKVQLNPPKDYVITEDDMIVAISEDDDTVIVNGKCGHREVEEIKSNDEYTFEKSKVSTLILGYNSKIPLIVTEFANYFPDGSTIQIIAQEDLQENMEKLNVEGLSTDIKYGDITSGKFLNSLKVEDYDYIIILAENGIDIQQADANTLVTLLHIRDIVKRNNFDINVVSEMLDPMNMELARISQNNDFIVSEKLVSLLLTMISENKYLKPVIEDLLDADGSEIYFKPAMAYVKENQECTFYQISKLASDFDQVAIGYRIMSKSNDPNANYGIVMNPNKEKLVKFSAEDKLIVLAED